jgi:hypothetical protein
MSPTTYTLGYVDQLKAELVDRIGGLEAAVVELALLRAGLAALGGPEVPEDPRDVQHRKDADRVSRLEDRNRALVSSNEGLGAEVERQRTEISQLKLQLEEISAGGVKPHQLSDEELAAELSGLRRENDELQRELAECRRKCAEAAPEDEPADDSPKEASERKPAVLLTDEMTRDYVLAELKGSPFSTAVIAEHFDVSIPTARRRLTSLARQDIIRRPAGSPVRGSQARWEYNSSIPANPRAKPRGENLLGVPAPRRNAGPVPGTGVPHGPAETPGKLKRQQQKAARVQHKPVKGVRL